MPYELSDDSSRIDVEAVYDFLIHQSYWAQDRSRETVQKSIDNSYCIAAYGEDGTECS